MPQQGSTEILGNDDIFAGANPEAVSRLRPFTTAELLDRSFQVYRRHFFPLVLFAGLIRLPAYIVGLSLAMATNSGLQSSSQIGFLILGFILFGCLVLLTEVGTLGLTDYCGRLVLGATTSIKGSLLAVAQRLWSALGTVLLYFALITASFFVGALFLAVCVFGLVYAGFEPGLPLFSLLLLSGVISLIPFLVGYLRLIEIYQAFSLDRLWGLDAIIRSNELASYNPGKGFWYWGGVRLSLLLLVVFVVGALLGALSQAPQLYGAISNSMRGVQGAAVLLEQPYIVIILTQVLSFMTESLVSPLSRLVTTLYYLDVRVRKEGLDIELMTQAPQHTTAQI